MQKVTPADVLFVLAVLALIYFCWRSTAPFSPSDFGIGIGSIFGGKGAHAWGKAQGDPQ